MCPHRSKLQSHLTTVLLSKSSPAPLYCLLTTNRLALERSEATVSKLGRAVWGRKSSCPCPHFQLWGFHLQQALVGKKDWTLNQVLILLFFLGRAVRHVGFYPNQGWNPVPPVVGVKSLNRWTAREVPGFCFCMGPIYKIKFVWWLKWSQEFLCPENDQMIRKVIGSLSFHQRSEKGLLSLSSEKIFRGGWETK